jgi:predicted ribonuclease toxin of YeeF-YezG toxin-antitoxin module
MRDVADAITRFIQLEDGFRGKAGDSIRDFYATCHIPFIQFGRLFLRDYESALKSIKDSLIDLEPSVDGFIDTSFVVNDVHRPSEFKIEYEIDGNIFKLRG